ncbi:hypothetical protein MKEN_00210900 [Mycena kentingensis (nom. inval.)]|nr:hypothetical protein MKEN_00210900 [Mycena kentingensis (nom. inval.)]
MGAVIDARDIAKLLGRAPLLRWLGCVYWEEPVYCCSTAAGPLQQLPPTPICISGAPLLRSFRLFNYTLSRCIPLLAQAAHLHRCRLALHVPFGSEPPVSTPVEIVLPSLHTLVLELHDTHATAYRTLQYFTLPALRRLQLASFLLSDQTTPGTFRDLVSRSKCSIDELHVSDTDLASRLDVEAAANVASARTLVIREDPTTWMTS